MYVSQQCYRSSRLITTSASTYPLTLPAPRVSNQDPDAPSITLADGSVITADLVVGADGIHSLACEAVLGHKVEPASPAHYNCCYRFLIPAATLEADPETRFWNYPNANHEDGSGKPGLRIITHNGTNRRMVSYPCRK